MFKVRFPSGYVINNISDDNIDINVYTPDGNIFFATLFTLKNISSLMNKEGATYFWADSMIVVENLEKKTIKATIKKIIEDSYLNSAFSYIGEIGGESSVYATYSGIISDI